MIGSVFHSALSGLQFNQRNFERHAGRIAAWGTTGDDGSISLEEEIIGVIRSSRGYEANLAVVRAADEMLGSLIDVLA